MRNQGSVRELTGAMKRKETGENRKEWSET